MTNAGKRLQLKAVIFRHLPVERAPGLQILHGHELVFCSDGVGASGGETPVLNQDTKTGFFMFQWEHGVELDKEFSVLCSFGKDGEGGEGNDLSPVLFRYGSSALLLETGFVRLTTRELSVTELYKDAFVGAKLTVGLVLNAMESKIETSAASSEDSKYTLMLKRGVSFKAVQNCMRKDGVDPSTLKPLSPVEKAPTDDGGALDLGPDAIYEEVKDRVAAGQSVSKLQSAASSRSGKEASTAVKPKRLRKMLHWQPLSDDRPRNRQAIWEDDAELKLDMDELGALFFASQNSGKSSSSGPSRVFRRKQVVTLIDRKRAMNAAISLARVKFSNAEIAQAVSKFDPNGMTIEQLLRISEILPTSAEAALVSGYTGDKGMLGEAEKFFLEIAKVKRYAPRMESLVYKISFTSRSAALSASLSHLEKASKEVNGSRLFKILLAVVLKLGNALNGSGEDNRIKGFTVDSLLRLGDMKAVNRTTALHYLVKLLKKQHPQVLDFQAELPSVPLAARESFDAIDQDFKKLERGLTSLNKERALLEKEVAEGLGLEVVITSMQTAASEIEAQMKALKEGIDRAREEASIVLDWFDEDPKKNTFFTTLDSFCKMFQRARDEVDAADEAEQLKTRRVEQREAPASLARL